MHVFAVAIKEHGQRSARRGDGARCRGHRPGNSLQLYCHSLSSCHLQPIHSLTSPSSHRLLIVAAVVRLACAVSPLDGCYRYDGREASHPTRDLSNSWPARLPHANAHPLRLILIFRSRFFTLSPLSISPPRPSSLRSTSSSTTPACLASRAHPDATAATHRTGVNRAFNQPPTPARPAPT